MKSKLLTEHRRISQKWSAIAHQASIHRLDAIAHRYSLAKERLNYLVLGKLHQSINLPRSTTKDWPRIDIYVDVKPTGFSINYLTRYRGKESFKESLVQQRLVQLCQERAELHFPDNFYSIEFDDDYVGVSLWVGSESLAEPFSNQWIKEQFLTDHLNIHSKPRYLKTIYLEKEQTKIALGLVPESHFDFAQSHPNIAEVILRQYANWHGIRCQWGFQHDPNRKYSWKLIANTKQFELIYLKILE